MAVGDGFQRYIFVENKNGKVEPVSFTDYDPVNMRPRGLQSTLSPAREVRSEPFEGLRLNEVDDK